MVSIFSRTFSILGGIITNYKFLKTGLGFLVIFLLIGVAISPIINANTYNNDDTKFIQKTSDVIYNSEDSGIFCEILKRLGIFLEELYKNFPEGTIIYPFLIVMMLPVILLWNNFCDEYVISYDLSLTGNLQINHII